MNKKTTLKRLRKLEKDYSGIPLNCNQIGKAAGCTGKNVNKILRKALIKLHKYCKKNGIQLSDFHHKKPTTQDILSENQLAQCNSSIDSIVAKYKDPFTRPFSYNTKVLDKCR